MDNFPCGDCRNHAGEPQDQERNKREWNREIAVLFFSLRTLDKLKRSAYNNTNHNLVLSKDGNHNSIFLSLRI